jgi:hypothetical protein
VEVLLLVDLWVLILDLSFLRIQRQGWLRLREERVALVLLEEQVVSKDHRVQVVQMVHLDLVDRQIQPLHMQGDWLVVMQEESCLLILEMRLLVLEVLVVSEVLELQL